MSIKIFTSAKVCRLASSSSFQFFTAFVMKFMILWDIFFTFLDILSFKFSGYHRAFFNQSMP